MKSTPTRVLLITDHHAPTGGAEKYFFTLKEILKKQPNLEVFSLGFGDKSLTGEDFCVIKGGDSNLSKLAWRMFFNPIKFWQLRRYIRKINPDVIHLHNVKKYTISLFKAVRGYRVIQTIHDYSLVCPTAWNLHQDMTPCSTGLTQQCFWQHKRNLNSLIYSAMVFYFKRRQFLTKNTVKQLLSPSPLLADTLTQQKFTSVTVLPNFKKENSVVNFDAMKPNHFLYLGQLGAHKGVDILIQEFHHAFLQNPHLMLKIAGTGPQTEFLKNQVRELGLEKNIVFLGWTNDIESLLNECTALVFPSIGLEPAPTVLVEAMSAARAVIGSRRGPTTWLVEENKTGLLFDPLKKGELANCLLTLANDFTLAQTLGKNGLQKFQQLPGNAEIINRMLEIYHSD